MISSEHAIADASALPVWRKSSYSGNSAGDCLEVSDGYATGVPVRDSKNPHGPALVFDAAAWASFLEALRRGEFGSV